MKAVKRIICLFCHILFDTNSSLKKNSERIKTLSADRRPNEAHNFFHSDAVI